VVGGGGAHRAEVDRRRRRRRRTWRSRRPARRARASSAASASGQPGVRDAHQRGVGAEVGHHAPSPPSAGSLWCRQAVAGGVGGGEHLDVEALEQRARTELGADEPLGDLVVHAVGGGRRELHPHAEQLVQLVVEPHARRGAAEQVVVLGEAPPDHARVALEGHAAGAVARLRPLHRDAQRFQGDALGVEHPEDVVVGRDEERRGLGERQVVGEEGRVDVAVRADEGQGARLVVERARGAAHRRVRVEEPVGVERQRLAAPGVHGRRGGGGGGASRRRGGRALGRGHDGRDEEARRGVARVGDAGPRRAAHAARADRTAPRDIGRERTKYRAPRRARANFAWSDEPADSRRRRAAHRDSPTYTPQHPLCPRIGGRARCRRWHGVARAGTVWSSLFLRKTNSDASVPPDPDSCNIPLRRAAQRRPGPPRAAPR
jgi:hypothetical protein